MDAAKLTAIKKDRNLRIIVDVANTFKILSLFVIFDIFCIFVPNKNIGRHV